MRGSSCVVTGGAGFIGSHLAGGLLQSGARRIVLIDNLRTGAWSNAPADPRVEQVTADLASLSKDEFGEILRGSDYLFHLAAEKHNQAIDIPQRVLEVNVNATFRLFAAAAGSVRKVVFTSSLYAYGRMTLPPMRETDKPEPLTVYGISKLTGEHLLRHFAATRGLRSTALRLFFVYGPRQFAGSGYKSVIVTNFERILRGERPVIFGDGEQALDYVYVDDVVRALIAAGGDRAGGEVINIGSGTAVSVNELTRAMLAAAHSSLDPVHAAPDATSGTTRLCDNSRARALLGWSPAVGLRDGLGRVYDWMRQTR